MYEINLMLNNKVGEISRLTQFVKQIGRDLELSKAMTMSLNVVLEEAVTNIIFYAYPPDENHQLEIKCIKSGDFLTFTIIDTGYPFDLTQVKEVDISLSAQDRPIGGLGVFLIKKIMTEVSYKRENNKNVLTLKKELK